MRTHQLLLAILWMVLTPSQAQAGYKMYLKITGINGASGGESTDPGHEGWIDILSFNHSASQPYRSSYTGGGIRGGVEKVSFSRFEVVRKVDKGSPILWLKALNGNSLSTITFECMSGDTSPKILFRIQLEGARLISTFSNYSIPPQNPIPTYINNGLTENLKFDFAKIVWTAYSYDANGVQTDRKMMYWDLPTNTGG